MSSVHDQLEVAATCVVLSARAFSLGRGWGEERGGEGRRGEERGGEGRRGKERGRGGGEDRGGEDRGGEEKGGKGSGVNVVICSAGR